MKRGPKPPRPEEPRTPPSAEAAAILQIKVWLVGICPMVCRRVLVSAAFTLRELHGVIQVTMGWEGSTSTISSYARRAVARRRWLHRRPT